MDRRVRLRDDHAFEQRKATIIAILDDDGDVTIHDTGRVAPERAIRFELDAPEHGLAATGRFRYGEVFRRDGDGWILESYTYDYIDLERGGRRAYHRHDLPGRSSVFHEHCRPPGGRPSISHFRSYDVDLIEAHEEFAMSYASETAIDCTGLRPLRNPSEEDGS
ncbi:MAG: hypothetical protein C0498_05825 [Anaerolinea sp.]|nr:hypothetical protein [Anaerolinea sp.]